MNRNLLDVPNAILVISALVFILYWAISAVGVKKQAAGKGGWMRWVLVRLAVVVIAIALRKQQASTRFLDALYGLPFFHNQAVRITGAVLTVLGLAFAIWARRQLGRNWSAQPTIQVGHELVTSGPYRFVRHPIYTGILTAWFGASLVQVALFLVFVPIAFMFFRRIRIEETYMMKLFPEQYPAYRARTKALIPGIW